MPSNAETIKLILETQGADGLNALIAAAEKAKVSLRDSYEVGERAVESYRLMASAAQTAADAEVAAAVERTNAQRAVGRALEETAAKTGTAAGKSKRGFLELGRVVQDFSQGGLAGVLNNVEGLTTALGGTAGLAGALTMVGVAVFTLMPQIKGFIDTISAGKFGVPEASEEIDKLTDAYTKNAKELDALKEKGKLDLAESFRAKELTAEQKRLGAEIADARAVKGVTNDQSEAASRRGAAVRRAVAEFGGGGEGLALDIANLDGFEGGKAGANAAVAAAMRGHEGHLDDLLKVPEFANLWNTRFNPAIEDKRKADADKKRKFDDRRRKEERKLDDRTNADVAVLEFNDSENAKADAETDRLRAETDRNRKLAADKAARDAPRLARQARLEHAAGLVTAAGNARGMSATPAEVLETAKAVNDNMDGGMAEWPAVMDALNQLLIKQQQLNQAAQGRAAQAARFGQMARSLPVQSDPTWPGE